MCANTPAYCRPTDVCTTYVSISRTPLPRNHNSIVLKRNTLAYSPKKILSTEFDLLGHILWAHKASCRATCALQRSPQAKIQKCHHRGYSRPRRTTEGFLSFPSACPALPSLPKTPSNPQSPLPPEQTRMQEETNGIRTHPIQPPEAQPAPAQQPSSRPSDHLSADTLQIGTRSQCASKRESEPCIVAVHKQDVGEVIPVADSDRRVSVSGLRGWRMDVE